MKSADRPPPPREPALVRLPPACHPARLGRRPDWPRDRPQPGATASTPPDQAYFDALAGTVPRWVRLTFSKWKGQHRDFLIGDADAYAGLVPEDPALRHAVVLDRAERARG